MTTYVVHPKTGQLIPKAEYRREGGAPAVVGDTVAPFQCQVTGKTYDSLSSYRAGLKAEGARRGTEYIEVGNDTAALRREMNRGPSDLGGRAVTEQIVAQTLQRFGL